MQQDIAVGLDIGTTKVCAIVASPDETYPGKLKVLGIGRSQSDGLIRGVVTNIEKTVRSIQTAVGGPGTIRSPNNRRHGRNCRGPHPELSESRCRDHQPA